MIMKIAPTWSENLNVDFKFSEDPVKAHVVINCDPTGGMKSPVGQKEANDVITQLGYSMNLAFNKTSATDPSRSHLITRAVLHEFG